MVGYMFPNHEALPWGLMQISRENENNMESSTNISSSSWVLSPSSSMFVSCTMCEGSVVFCFLHVYPTHWNSNWQSRNIANGPQWMGLDISRHSYSFSSSWLCLHHFSLEKKTRHKVFCKFLMKWQDIEKWRTTLENAITACKYFYRTVFEQENILRARNYIEVKVMPKWHYML